MTQSIIVQVGQCGNQIGCRFWELALKEYKNIKKNHQFDESMSSFFNISDFSSTNKNTDIFNSIKARAILIDMEEGVVSHIMKGPLKNIFNNQHFVTDVSGSGNNWAVGNFEYGQKHQDEILNVFHKATEECDYLQNFFIVHSMGGGTGSGLGSYILKLLCNEYPDIFRFDISVFPSKNDDVITSPYNSVLAMNSLYDFADCILPIENQSLINIIERNMNIKKKESSNVSTSYPLVKNKNDGHKKNSFDQINDIVANLLINLTSSSRFEGSLNVDLNEITMNLVPYPHVHYLISSQIPIYSRASFNILPKKLDYMFNEAFLPDNQMMQLDPRSGIYLACALLLRGNVEISDIKRNIEKLNESLNFVSWNKEGWKTGLCSEPSLISPHSLLALGNNSCIWNSFENLKERFLKIYSRKAHLHHYKNVEGMDNDLFNISLEKLDTLIDSYKSFEISKEPSLNKYDRLGVRI